MEISNELKQAFMEIQQPRTPYQIEKFVVGQHDTEEMQYAQCVLELQIKYNNIRRAIINRKIIEKDIEILLAKGDDKSFLKAELKKIDLEEQDSAMIGAIREFDILNQIWENFPVKYNRTQLNFNQEAYWQKRLTREASYELQAQGRIGKGTIEALTQIGRSPIPELDHIRDTEKKFLENHPTKILIVVPTEVKADTLPCVEGLLIPNGMQVKYYNVYGRPVADAYNDAMMAALHDATDYILTIEDDTFPPPEALLKLKDHNTDVVGGWYPKRVPTREGTPIVIVNNKREALAADGNTHECYTLPMGCTLFKTDVFRKIPYPWFVTTSNLTQDSFFSELARQAGYKLLCDTSIRCKHIDRVTGEVYE